MRVFRRHPVPVHHSDSTIPEPQTSTQTKKLKILEAKIQTLFYKAKTKKLTTQTFRQNKTKMMEMCSVEKCWTPYDVRYTTCFEICIA